MLGFDYRENQLHCDGVSMQELASRVDTPFYCYSAAVIREQFGRYRDQFSMPGSMVCYAVKANSNPSVLGLLGSLGAGADVVSAGELRQALDAGIPAERIVFSGVAKTAADMRYGLESGIFQFNVESEPELEQLSATAVALGREAPVAFRINPDIDAGTHEKITTGKALNKFGIPRSRASEVYARAAELPGIRVQGIATHIGSQLTDLAPFEQSFRCHARLVEKLRRQGHGISVLDIGGGLGIDYRDGAPEPPRVESYAALAREILEPLACRILVEPGRSIVGEAGVLIARVVYVKEGEQVCFLIIDAGMNDLLRPSLYDAQHEITAVCPAGGRVRPYDVVGPVCETGDTFARQLDLPPMRPGELVAIRNAGAYGAVMASTYNSRPLVPEVMVEADCVSLVRRRTEVHKEIVIDVLP